uniref:RGS domain-containing protein n=1 Tax=Rhabditophanes sp. KR3021 TaxID=114890 RepID=A0AC35THH6_9BILA
MDASFFTNGAAWQNYDLANFSAFTNCDPTLPIDQEALFRSYYQLNEANRNFALMSNLMEQNNECARQDSPSEMSDDTVSCSSNDLYHPDASLISAEKIHTFIFKGDKELADAYMNLYINDPTKSEKLSQFLIMNTYEAIKSIVTNNACYVNKSLSELSYGGLSPNSATNSSACSTPSVLSDNQMFESTYNSIFEGMVSKVVTEKSGTAYEVDERMREAALSLLFLKNGKY